MGYRINKEKEGLTVRFSIRLPKEQHDILRAMSKKAKDNEGTYISMNEIISRAVESYIKGE